jgi:membrane fusion protein (multidrug efflux system)
VADNARVKKGDVIAILDSADLEARVKQAQGELDAAKAQAASADAQIASAQAQLVRAQADLRKVSTDLDRQKQLRAANAVPQERVDNAQASYDAAQAALQAAQADLEVADNAVRRAKRLVDAGAAAPTELENATSARKGAEARVRAAQAGLNNAEENAQKLSVTSPLRGTVSHVLVHSGDRTAVGDKLMTLVDTSTMELSATVPSEVLSSVRPGTAIEFRVDAFPGETFTGRLDRLNPTTEPGTRQVRVYMRLPNPDHKLVGGLFASGRIIRAVQERATAAPLAALRQEGGEQVVYRMRNGLAERLAVQVGIVDEVDGVVGLKGGPAPGDSLLTGVLPGLRPGARVRILSGTTNGGGAAAEGTGGAGPASAAPAAGR